MPKLKTLFETPKKAALTVACLLVMLVTLGTASVYAASAFARSSAIGEDAAANFAFADAGVDPASAQRLRVEFDREEDRFVYEVEFTADGAEYEYRIDSKDGSVVKKEKKALSAPQGGQPGGMTPSKTLEEAGEIALADAGVTASNVVFTEEELDQDNGLWVYEFTFRTENAKFEYEINANTGDIYSKYVETFVTPSQSPASTPEPAPESTPGQVPAAQPPADVSPVYTHHPDDYDYDNGHHYDDHSSNRHHTGTVSSGITLDRDDGRMVYEIEFRQGQVEYEYKIDAQSGAVLEHEIDRD